MSLRRLVSAQKLATAGKGGLRNSKVIPGLRSSELVRWQSQSAPRGGAARGRGRATRLFLYGITATGLSFGASLVYANYDPAFKYRVDLYVPGFARLADLAADRWVDLVDYVSPKDRAGVGLKREEKIDSTGPTFGLRRSSPKEGRPSSKVGEGESRNEVGQKKPTLAHGSEVPTEASPPPPTPAAKDMAMLEKELEAVARDVKLVEEVRAAEKELAMEPQREKLETIVETPPPAAAEKPIAEAQQEEPMRPAVAVTPEMAAAETGSEEEEEIRPAAPEVLETSLAETGHPQDQTEEGVPGTLDSQPLAEAAVREDTEAESAASVESAVASAREETARETQEIISEQIKEHQEAQSSDEHFQWLKDSSQVEATLQKAYDSFVAMTDKVLEAQKTVAQAVRDHHQKITEATTAPPTNETAAPPTDENMDTVAKGIAGAEEAVDEARQELQTAQLEHREVTTQLQALLEKATELGLKTKADQVYRKLTELTTELLTGAASIAEAESDSRVMEEYQREAERSREELQKELGTALPKMDSQQEALILLLQRRVEVLKSRLEKVAEEQKRKLAEGLEHQKENLEKLFEDRTRWRLQKQDRDYQQDMQQKLEEIARQYEAELREQLRIQTDTHTNHLEEALQIQAERLSQKWASELEQKLREQEAHYHKELARAMAKLRGVESMVDAVINAGEVTRHQQSLRAACDSLSDALHVANSNPDPEERYVFGDEVTALCEAAKDNPFALSVLEAFPREALEVGCGIQSEAGLKERFRRVKKICRRVALVPQTGGGLGTYALSYLQSLLTIKASWLAPYAIDSQTDPTNMDTFELLQRADAHLRRAELEEAVGCVNLLQGEARRVAHGWLVDARLYLETKQAVELVLCHMAATSVSLAQTK